MIIHSIFDLLAIILAFAANRFFRLQFKLKQPAVLPDKYRYSFLLVLILGMALGSILFGTVNTSLAGIPALSKSLLGGIAGAVLFAEIFKKTIHIKGSTGFYFIPGLCVLIVIGRIGCYLAGLPDYTYGIQTSVPWAVDFGDGVLRHPVQLYESFSMLFFLLLIFASYKKHTTFWLNKGFYLFIFFYAGQRFLWEFLKPYPTVTGPLNLFHLLAIAMMLYATFMLWNTPKQYSHV